MALIDSFVAFEVAINRWLIKAPGCSDSSKLSVGQRIERLRGADLTTLATTGQQKRLKTILDEAEALLDLRNAIAHGIAKNGKIGDRQALLIQNSSDAAKARPNYYVVAIDDLSDAKAKLGRFVRELTHWLTPPSPPRPKPDAAACP